MSSKRSGCRRLQQVPHAARLELEHRGGLAPLQQRVGRRVVARARSPRSSGSPPARSARALIVAPAQSMIVSVRRPRKSNLTSPAASTSSLSNCVTTLVAAVFAVERREVGEHATARSRRRRRACRRCARGPRASARDRSASRTSSSVCVAAASSAALAPSALVERDAELRTESASAMLVDVAVGHAEHARRRRATTAFAAIVPIGDDLRRRGRGRNVLRHSR